jgi:hypothetical protein
MLQIDAGLSGFVPDRTLIPSFALEQVRQASLICSGDQVAGNALGMLGVPWLNEAASSKQEVGLELQITDGKILEMDVAALKRKLLASPEAQSAANKGTDPIVTASADSCSRLRAATLSHACLEAIAAAKASATSRFVGGLGCQTSATISVDENSLVSHELGKLQAFVRRSCCLHDKRRPTQRLCNASLKSRPGKKAEHFHGLPQGYVAHSVTYYLAESKAVPSEKARSHFPSLRNSNRGRVPYSQRIRSVHTS